MDGDKNSNSLVLLMVAGGLYLLTRNPSASSAPGGRGASENDKSQTVSAGPGFMMGGQAVSLTGWKSAGKPSRDAQPSTETPYVPLAVVAFVLYSLRNEIQASVSTERMIVLTAMVLSSYVTSIGGSFLLSSGTTASVLILLPALHHASKEK